MRRPTHCGKRSGTDTLVRSIGDRVMTKCTSCNGWGYEYCPYCKSKQGCSYCGHIGAVPCHDCHWDEHQQWRSRADDKERWSKADAEAAAERCEQQRRAEEEA